MVEFEFSMGNCDFGGRLMVGSMFIVLESMHTLIWMNWLWFGFCMCVLIGLGSQVLEEYRGKQPETSNKWRK